MRVTLDSGNTDSYNKDGIANYMFKGSQVKYPNKCVLQALNLAFIIANSADPDELQQTTKLYKVFIPHYQMSLIE